LQTRVLAASAPAPAHLAAPAAGLLTLTSAAVPAASSPQLLHPAVSLGLEEAAALVAALAAAAAGQEAPWGSASASASASTSSGSGPAASSAAAAPTPAAVQLLTEFDQQYKPDAVALHKLLAQLSWLRHAHSPAATTAATSVPAGSLAWLCGLACGAPRAGLVVQWRCLLALLPLVAAAQRVMLHKLGLGRADEAPVLTQRAKQRRFDASYRRTPLPGASTSLDSGVHLDGSSGGGIGGIGAAASQRTPRSSPGAAAGAAAGAQAPPCGMSELLDAIEPCGSSLLALLHTTSTRPARLWRLLQMAPLLLSVLWGAAFWFAWQAVRWAVWGWRACMWAWSQAGAA
jgi:hypothetical protein